MREVDLLERSMLMARLIVVLAILPLLVGSWGCGRQYSQDTPDDVLRSARAMVENGDAHRLPDLLHAETPELRQLLTQFGKVMGSLQALALELHRAYPEEIAQIKAQAEEAASRGDATGFFGRMVGGMGGPVQQRTVQMRGRRSGASPSPQGGMQQSFNDMAKELFADPYGWLERSEGRLSTQYVADDLAAILWDGKPAFGVGLLMKQERGKWYIMLPSMVPGAGQILPSTEEMWQIAGALTSALDNAIKDTQREVRAGKHPTLEDLSRSVGEKAAVPAIMIMFAYQRAAQVERQERRQRERQEREAREAAQRGEGGGGG
jgi:hypothetical protein